MSLKSDSGFKNECRRRAGKRTAAMLGSYMEKSELKVTLTVVH